MLPHKKLKIMTVVGTRPEIIRLSAVMKRLDDCEVTEHVVVHTGQNYDYELNEIFFKDFGLRKPDYFLNAALGNASETIGNILIKLDPILEEVKPDAFLILGDTNSCLSAIPAKNDRFLSSTWKLAIAVLIRESPKRRTVRWSITSVISI